ncbi:T9SS type A sorting domain-containing protein [Rufibacter psychrotolerans]|uniref:T9SS type A sorting domain-containing protein n=1 Tax=Rufibacter psychrotolerans TaxID=2812556 RepID=UPI0019676137|nr:T9SS type A sorting domain-containing protein [Rufibacter sp. SYSU D00308]
MKNSSGSVIEYFKVRYRSEGWFKETGKTATVTMSYKVAAGSSVNVPGLTTNLNTSNSGAHNGNELTDEKSFIIRGVNLPAGGEIEFTWNVGTGKWGIGIDDVVIEPVKVINFYNKPGADISLLTTWGTNPDGTGIQPLNFSSNDQVFQVVNQGASLLNSLSISGTNAKLVVGNGLDTLKIESAAGRAISGTVDLSGKAVLAINGPGFPSFGQLSPQSTVIFGRSAPAEITAGVEFGAVVIEPKAGNSRFSKPVKVKGRMTLKAGATLDVANQVELFEQDLVLEEGAAILNGSASNYIVLNGKGRVRKPLKAGEEVELPVGRKTRNGQNVYNPVKIKLAAGAQADVFSIGIIEGVYSLYNNDVPVVGTEVLTKAVNRTWVVSEDVKGGSNVTLTFTWSEEDVLPGFDPKNCHIKHYENGKWDDFAAGVAFSQTVAVTNQDGTTTNKVLYSMSRDGITSFSPFIQATGLAAEAFNPTPLPVELVEFTARAGKQGGVELGWATASEQDNAFFAVERSRDGKTFAEVGRVRGGGTTAVRQAYRFTDAAPLAGVSYYRLRQVDFDGGQEYSAVRAVRLAAGQAAGLSLRPNPSQGQGVAVQVQGPAAEVLVYDLAGRQVLRRPVGGQGQALLEAGSLGAGTYLVRAGAQAERLVVR